MNRVFIAPFLVALIMSSCKEQRKLSQDAHEQPKALTGKVNAKSYDSRRGYGDLVEGLYGELVEKDTVLQNLERQINDLETARTDSAKGYLAYDEKNRGYYNSTEVHMLYIKDSLLRDRVRAIIKKSSADYASLTSGHQALIQKSEDQAARISDLHQVVKLLKTLPLIEDYQKKNLPSLKPIEGLIKQQERTIRLADSLGGMK